MSPAFGQRPPWAGDPHHALAVIYARQILLKLLPNLEVHDVVSKSAQRADDHMVAVLHDLFVWLQQVGDFAQGHIDICRGPGREGQRVGRKTQRTARKAEGPGELPGEQLGFPLACTLCAANLRLFLYLVLCNSYPPLCYPLKNNN